MKIDIHSNLLEGAIQYSSERKRGYFEKSTDFLQRTRLNSINIILIDKKNHKIKHTCNKK